MTLTINLNESEMATLAEIARVEGREPADFAKQVLNSYLALDTHLPQRPGLLAQVPATVSSRESSRPRRSAHALKGKYRHLNVSTQTLSQSRADDIAREETRFKKHFDMPGDSA